MPTETLERFPKTVSACHAEIIRLRIAVHPDVIDAVDSFLYQVERPVGQFRFDVIHEPATDRAIVRLFDAVGRQP